MKPVKVDIVKYQEVVKDYHGESDRAAAVLVGSFIEEFTRKYARSLMVEDSSVDEVLNGYGPLATFSARIDCLYAFGFIDPGMRDDLNMIRKIRNHFAHHPERTSFDESPVKDLCGNLSTAQPIKCEDGSDYRVESRRQQYLFAIGMIVVMMHNNILLRGKQNSET